MKGLLLAPVKYPFIRAIEAGIRAHHIELKTVDYPSFFSPFVNRFVHRFTNLPNRLKSPWEGPYEKKINRSYRQVFDEFQPDFVFIYNNQLVHPWLLEYMQGKSKIVFMLGDNPLYTRTSITNLHILFYADYIISPDSMWCEQLTKLGIRNVVFDCFGFADDVYYPKEPSPEEFRKYQSEFIYVGTASKINWGYKRTLFLNMFKDYDLKAYISGEGMDRWLKYFPDLEGKILPHNRYDPAFNNLVYNCSKIAPVEQVPSLFKGVHVRVCDALGAGILPLCEYSADLLYLFEGIDIPLIRNYREGPEIIRHWITHDQQREACVQQMRARILERYTPAMVIGRMLNEVFEKSSKMSSSV